MDNLNLKCKTKSLDLRHIRRQLHRIMLNYTKYYSLTMNEEISKGKLIEIINQIKNSLQKSSSVGIKITGGENIQIKNNTLINCGIEADKIKNIELDLNNISFERKNELIDKLNELIDATKTENKPIFQSVLNAINNISSTIYSILSSVPLVQKMMVGS